MRPIFQAGDRDEDYAVSKDPDETIDLAFDWSRALGSDTISASTWEIGDGLTSAAAATASGYRTTAWISGGECGLRSRCVNQVVTAAGRTLRRSILVRIETR